MKSGQAPQNPFEKIKDMAQEVDNPTKTGRKIEKIVAIPGRCLCMVGVFNPWTKKTFGC